MDDNNCKTSKSNEYSGTIMLNKESTRMQNEIMRRIKMEQMKIKNLPNFIRKKKEEIIAEVEYL